MAGVSTIYEKILEPLKSFVDLGSSLYIRTAVNGAGKIKTETRDVFEKITGVYLGIGFGSTETGIVSLEHPERVLDEVCTEGLGGSCIGRVLSDIQTEIRNETGEICTPHQTGVLYVKTKSSMVGYLNDLEATNKTKDVLGWICMGDLAYKDAEGRLWFVGRDGYGSGKRSGSYVYSSLVENLLSSDSRFLYKACIARNDRLDVFVVVGDSANENYCSEIKRNLPKTIVEKLGNLYKPNTITVLRQKEAIEQSYVSIALGKMKLGKISKLIK
jgi:acyl-coenzyme A synthetase/AMP-(fatty) acid ligase